MRFVVSLQGTALVRVSPDDYSPKRGILQRALVGFVNKAYHFSGAPTPPIGLPYNPVLIFQNGEFINGETRMPIAQITMYPDGDAVTATDTDVANIVLSDLLARLDRELGYRYSSAEAQRIYSSALVVEFEQAFVKVSDTLQKIQVVLNARFSERPYGFKRLSFGTAAEGQGILSVTVPSLTITQLIQNDFTIDRRAGEPFERNRFFCSAPLSTADLVETLEQIERAVIG